MSTSELRGLLTQFDTPQYVEQACWNIYGQRKHFAVPSMISKAAKDGLIKSVDGSPVFDSPTIYPMDMLLTDAGRVFCGLPPVSVNVEKRKPKALFD